jgi:hypothetical protein
MKRFLAIVLCLLFVTGLLVLGCQRAEPPAGEKATGGYGAPAAGGYGEEGAGGYGPEGAGGYGPEGGGYGK